jgi:MFS family permease
MLFIATALSGAFGGLIAYGVLQMDNVSGVAGWRWRFYIEGLISFVVGIFAFFFLPSNADEARCEILERRGEERGSSASRSAQRRCRK